MDAFAENPRGLFDCSGFSRVDIGESQVGVLRVGNFEENPGLSKCRDNKPASGRPFERVEDGQDVAGEDLPTLGRVVLIAPFGRGRRPAPGRTPPGSQRMCPDLG